MSKQADPITDICDVCGRETEVFVGASTMGPVSYAYCRQCLKHGLEPYGGIVAYVFTALEPNRHPRDCLATWAHEIIEASLRAAGKTWLDLQQDCLAMRAD